MGKGSFVGDLQTVTARLDYFRYFDHALVELARRRIGILEGSYRAEALMPLHRALQVIRNDILTALATFRTEAAAYHGRAGQ